MWQKLLYGLIGLCVLLGIYKFAHGDIGSIIETIGNVIIAILSKGSEIVAMLISKIMEIFS